MLMNMKSFLYFIFTLFLVYLLFLVLCYTFNQGCFIKKKQQMPWQNEETCSAEG